MPTRKPGGFLLFALLAACAIGAGCSEESSPTDSGPPQFVMAYTVGVFSRSTNSILQVQALVDDVVIEDHSYSPAVGVAYLGTSDIPLNRGTHRVSVRIARQSASPSLYMVVGWAVIVDASGATRQFRFPMDDVALKSGDAVTLTFSTGP